MFFNYIYIYVLRTICVVHSRFLIWWSVWCKHIPRGEYKWCLPDYGFIRWSTARLQSIGAPRKIELDLKVMFWNTTESNMAIVRPFQYGNFGVVANMSGRCEGFIHLSQACFPKKRIRSYLQNNQRKYLKVSRFGRCVFFLLWCCNSGGCELLGFRFRVYLHWLLSLAGQRKMQSLAASPSFTNILQTTPLWRSFKQHLSEGPSENTSSNIPWLSCSYFAFLPTIWMMDRLTIKGKFIQVKVLLSYLQLFRICDEISQICMLKE